MTSKPLPPDVIRMAAERFAALADETRIRIMIRLREGECNVSTLSDYLATAQPNVSKHLAILRRAGLVEMRRCGTQCMCGVSDASVFDMCDVVCSSVVQRQVALGRALGLHVAAPPGNQTAKRKPAATTMERDH